jgi:hypothetical protein
MKCDSGKSRPLEALYPIVYFDALFVKMRHEGRIENRAVYVAVGIRMDGTREILGLWTANTEGAKFWLMVLTELRNRGLLDVFIACVDGLKGFPEAPHREHLPEGSSTALHCPFDAAQLELCELQRPKGGRARLEGSIRSPKRGKPPSRS